MHDQKAQIIPLNSEINSGVSIEELEDRLEMQMIGLSECTASGSVVTSGHPCPVTVITPRQ